MFMGAHLYVLRYRKLCFALGISILQSNNRLRERIQYSVIQFFFAKVTALTIDSILYIKYII